MVSNRQDPFSNQGQEKYNNKTTPNNNKKVVVWIAVIILVNTAIILGYYYGDYVLAKYGLVKTESEIIPQENENTEIAKEKTTEALDTLSADTVKAQLSPDSNIIAETEGNGEVHHSIENSIRDYEKNNTPKEKSIANYHIIAGVFQHIDNANQLVKKLRQDGYNAEKIGKIGPYHAVSYGGHEDYEAAKTMLRKIHKANDKKAWIKKMN